MLVYVDPVSGKRATKSAGTRDRGQAERVAGEWEKELTTGRFAAPARLTWAEFRERFAAEKLAGMPASTQVAYTVALEHVTRLLDPDRLVKLTAPVISRLAGKLRATGIKETTIARHLRHVKAALRWAERMGLLTKAPTIDIPRPAKGQSLMKGRPITAEEFDRMLAAVPKVRPQDPEPWTRLLWGLWLSGLRLGEALALSWDSDAPLAVDFTGKRPVFVILARAQKARRDELLPMTPDFADWLMRTPEAERGGLVFKLPGKDGRQITTHAAGQILVRVGQTAGVVTDKAEGKYASAHDLRRAFGTRWSKRLMPAVLQRLMRHRDIGTTMNYYVKESAEDIAEDLWNLGPTNTFANKAPPGTEKDSRKNSASPYGDSTYQSGQGRG